MTPTRATSLAQSESGLCQRSTTLQTHTPTQHNTHTDITDLYLSITHPTHTETHTHVVFFFSSPLSRHIPLVCLSHSHIHLSILPTTVTLDGSTLSLSLSLSFGTLFVPRPRPRPLVFVHCRHRAATLPLCHSATVATVAVTTEDGLCVAPLTQTPSMVSGGSAPPRVSPAEVCRVLSAAPAPCRP